MLHPQCKQTRTTNVNVMLIRRHSNHHHITPSQSQGAFFVFLFLSFFCSTENCVHYFTVTILLITFSFCYRFCMEIGAFHWFFGHFFFLKLYQIGGAIVSQSDTKRIYRTGELISQRQANRRDYNFSSTFLSTIFQFPFTQLPDRQTDTKKKEHVMSGWTVLKNISKHFL